MIDFSYYLKNVSRAWFQFTGKNIFVIFSLCDKTLNKFKRQNMLCHISHVMEQIIYSVS